MNAVFYNYTLATTSTNKGSDVSNDLIRVKTIQEKKDNTVFFFPLKLSEFIVCWIITADWVISLKSALPVIGWWLPRGSIWNLLFFLLQTERQLFFFFKSPKQTMDGWTHELKVTDQLTHWIFDLFFKVQCKKVYTYFICDCVIYT